jgi:hypothetical protein
VAVQHDHELAVVVGEELADSAGVRGDLEGFFLIIMISLLDTFFQNPVDNPLANKPILEFFPSYAPTQFAAAGAFHPQALAGMVAPSLAWTAALALLGLVVLRLRMPRPARASLPSAGRRQMTAELTDERRTDDQGPDRLYRRSGPSPATSSAAPTGFDSLWRLLCQGGMGSF